MKIKQTPSISILIPAHNEQESIKRCVQSCINQSIKPNKIIVVDDGSTDNTLKILKHFKNKIRVVSIKKNTGNKSKAQEIGLKYIKTDIFITTDADTILDKHFVKHIRNRFMIDPELSAVCGYIKSRKDNWLTAVRDISYIIGQTIFKQAQSHIGALFVLAGCSTAFKTKDFKNNITFTHDTMTEDLDFTYRLKLKNKRLFFEKKAIVYTQDPNTIKSYVKQIYRWFSGGWDCLRKNISIFGRPNNALVLSLVYIEGLLMGGLFAMVPIFILLGWKMVLYFLLLELGVTVLTMFWGIWMDGKFNLIIYTPLYLAVHILDYLVFFFTFLTVIVFDKQNLVWHKAKRY